MPTVRTKAGYLYRREKGVQRPLTRGKGMIYLGVMVNLKRYQVCLHTRDAATAERRWETFLAGRRLTDEESWLKYLVEMGRKAQRQPDNRL